MLGAIAGDIVGSIYEHANIKTKDFPLFGPGCRFTDDTVLSGKSLVLMYRMIQDRPPSLTCR